LDSKIFEQDIPDEILEIIIEKAGGGRFRIPQWESKHNPRYREKRNKRICQRRLQGATLKELIIEFNLKKRRICKILKENGIQVREERKKSLKEEIKLYLKLGYGKSEIAKRVGKSRQWVYEFIRKEGLR